MGPTCPLRLNRARLVEICNLPAQRSTPQVRDPERHLRRRLPGDRPQEGRQGRLRAAPRGRLSPVELSFPGRRFTLKVVLARWKDDVVGCRPRCRAWSVSGRQPTGRSAKSTTSSGSTYRTSRSGADFARRRLGRPSASQGLRIPARVPRHSRPVVAGDRVAEFWAVTSTEVTPMNRLVAALSLVALTLTISPAAAQAPLEPLPLPASTQAPPEPLTMGVPYVYQYGNPNWYRPVAYGPAPLYGYPSYIRSGRPARSTAAIRGTTTSTSRPDSAVTKVPFPFPLPLYINSYSLPSTTSPHPQTGKKKGF